MRSARLTLAIASETFRVPTEGRIAVFAPRAGDDLSALPKDRVQVISSFRPDYDAFAGQGWDVSVAPEGKFAAALVCLPRAKASARALLAQADAVVNPGGQVAVDGQKTDGADALYRELRSLCPVSEPLAKAHGKVFSFAAGPHFGDWASAPSVVAGGFVTRPGVFSADGPDQGSALLAQALPAKLPASVVDLGAGWGYLSRAVLARDGVQTLDLVEADAVALDCARQNIIDPRARFHWADATSFKPAAAAGAVVCNPPFHTGRDADPALGLAFIAAAHRMLAPSGALYLVANRHLPYDRVLTALFKDITDIGGDKSFRLTRAALPIRASR